MMKLRRCFQILACSTLLAGPFAPQKAFACDTLTSAHPRSTCVVMGREGRPGVWFELSVANKLRRYKLEVPELRLQIERCEQATAVYENVVADLQEASELRQRSVETLESTIKSHVVEAREAKEDAAKARAALNSWFRSPWLWFGVGVVVTGGAALLILSL